MTVPDERAALAKQLLDLTFTQVRNHAVVLISPDGEIVGWMPGAERLFGYAADEVVGRQDAVLFTPEDLERRINEWERDTARRSGESEDDRWQVRKDGGRIWVTGTLTAVQDAQGTVLGFVKIMRNRTDQKSQIETLERRIAMLAEAAERRVNFVSTLAHELRNPLAAIANATQLLKASLLESPQIEFALGTVRRQIDFMGRMINDLLDVARAAAGKVSFHPARVSLQEIVMSAVDVTRPAIDRRGHALHCSISDAPILIEADAIRLRQVFVNLLENAAKYTPPAGSIWVKVATEGDEAIVRVQDTGIGIAADVMPHIFDLFTQADAKPEPEGGLGIGLSVVKDLVTMHGGSVQAASDGLGKGSNFIVRLPLPGSPHDRPVPTQPGPRGTGATSS